MNALTPNSPLSTKNTSVSVTYNVNMGVDGMNKQLSDKISVDSKNQKNFEFLLKTGIYKGLYSEGMISNPALIQLLDTKKGYTTCH